MDAEYAREVGIDLPKSVDDLDEVQVNVWICGHSSTKSSVKSIYSIQNTISCFPIRKKPI